jgi:hypothetical protein
VKDTIVQFLLEKTFKWKIKLEDFGWKLIEKVSSSKESFIPILEWHMSMDKQGEPNLNYVPMFALC